MIKAFNKIPKSSFNFTIVIIVLLFFLFNSYHKNSIYRNNNIKNLEAINQELTYYKNKEGKEVASKLSLKGENENLKLMLSVLNDSTDQLKKLLKEYKKVSGAVYTETIVKIDTIKVPYYIEGKTFNKSFEIIENNYSFSGISSNEGLIINNIQIPNKQSIVIGEKKTSFLKTEFKINVVNSNPYIKTTMAESYIYKEKKKRIGLGFQFGYGISNLTLTPYLGFGINYSLINF